MSNESTAWVIDSLLLFSGIYHPADFMNLARRYRNILFDFNDLRLWQAGPSIDPFQKIQIVSINHKPNFSINSSID